MRRWRCQFCLAASHSLPSCPAAFLGCRRRPTWFHQHADVHVNKILIGNKCDRDEDRVVSKEEGQKLANEYNIQFFETSAKNDIDVDKVTHSVARLHSMRGTEITDAYLVCFCPSPVCSQGFITIAGDVKDRLIAEGSGTGGGGGDNTRKVRPQAGKTTSSSKCC